MTNEGKRKRRRTIRAVRGLPFSSHSFKMAGRETQYGPMKGTAPTMAANTRRKGEG